MPACVDQELLLGGLADGELDAANTALVEAHVARCDACREELERLHGVRNLLRTEAVRHGVPEELNERILNATGSTVHAPSSRYRVPGWLAPGVTGALAASLAMVTLVSPAQEASVVDEQIISSHVRSLQPGHLIDVQTNNKHVVKPWFNGRVDFSPPVPDLAGGGFPLAGGRLDSVAGKTIPAIVYKRRLHTVNVFVWPASTGGTRSFEKDGFAVTEWTEDGLRFAAISDIPLTELRQFERLYRQRSR